MSLLSQLTTLVAAAEAPFAERALEPRVNYLIQTGAVALDSADNLTGRADMVGVIGNRLLEAGLQTSLSEAANDLLALLKELSTAGVITGLTFHDGGVTIRVLPPP